MPSARFLVLTEVCCNRRLHLLLSRFPGPRPGQGDRVDRSSTSWDRSTMPQVFNPPPNWPQPPADWIPPPNSAPGPVLGSGTAGVAVVGRGRKQVSTERAGIHQLPTQRRPGAGQWSLRRALAPTARRGDFHGHRFHPGRGGLRGLHPSRDRGVRCGPGADRRRLARDSAWFEHSPDRRARRLRATGAGERLRVTASSGDPGSDRGCPNAIRFGDAAEPGATGAAQRDRVE